MKLVSKCVALVMVLFAVSVGAEQKVNAKLSFSNAWVKMPMPGMVMTAGFVEITNLSDNPIELIGVKTSFSKMSELHDMKMTDGVMQMRRAEKGWTIGVNQTLKLAQGGKHAMLMGLHEALIAQQDIVLEFNFIGLGWVKVDAKVLKP